MHSAPPTYLGLDIGGTKTALCRWSAGQGLKSLAVWPTSGPVETLAEIKRLLRLHRPAELAGLGIACGNPLDAKPGLILSPPNLPGWDRVAIVRELRAELDCPVFLMNDANANALAEWRFGAGRKRDSMIFLTAGTGMGAGVILNGRLLEGACGNAGEVGHWRLADRGPIGYHKAGSFEGFCSGGALPELVNFLPRAQSPAQVAAWRAQHATTKSLAEAALAGDPTALAVFSEAGRRLGQAVALIIDAFNPECIVIGSLWVRCRALLEPTMRPVLEAECLPDSLRACRIVPAKLGGRVGDYGAICVALHGLGQLDQ